jgi:long-chain acyl-CoA synthetase
VEVIRAGGQRLGTGAEGELVVKSPFAAAGYLHNPVASAESFRHGRYFTGDIGHRDTDGFLFLTGRQKLLLNRGGLKVNPYEVEEAIAQHPCVEDVVVFGAPGPHGDDVVCCLVVPAAEVTVADILAHCRQRIADYKIPARVEFMNSLPRAASGKVLRARL